MAPEFLNHCDVLEKKFISILRSYGDDLGSIRAQFQSWLLQHIRQWQGKSELEFMKYMLQQTPNDSPYGGFIRYIFKVYKCPLIQSLSYYCIASSLQCGMRKRFFNVNSDQDQYS